MYVHNLFPLDPSGIPFATKPFWSLSSKGTPYQRWVPYGMPQLGQYKWISDIVCFLYPDAQHAKQGTQYGGTGFFVAYPSEKFGNDYFHIHAVTNWHVACAHGASVIRVNRHDGTTEIFEFEPHEWVFIPNGHDIAISPPIKFDKRIHKVEAIWAGSLLMDEERINDDIAAAEDVFMVGRFVDYEGAETNEPAYRFGNISILNANIKQPTGYFGPSVVIDMHSRTGFSGSPVFIYRTPGTVFPNGNELALTWHYIKLVGIHWGQFTELLERKDGRSESPALQASMITEGKYVEGYSGMVCASPASAIVTLLECKSLCDQRRQAEVGVELGGLSVFRPQGTSAGRKPSAVDSKRLVNKALGLDQIPFNQSFWR